MCTVDELEYGMEKGRVCHCMNYLNYLQFFSNILTLINSNGHRNLIDHLSLPI